MPAPGPDLTGQTFGKLYVVKRAEGTDKQGRKYLCRCECGNEKIIKAKSLISGDSISCGCVQASRRIPELKVGEKFGFLTIIKKSDDDPFSYLCQCDCGNTITAKGYRIHKGVVKSCGCLKHKTPKRALDVVGKRFGRLTVLHRIVGDKGGRCRCQCDCGNIVDVRAGALGRDTNSCGCLLKDWCNSPKEERKIMNRTIYNKYEFEGDICKCTMKNGDIFVIDSEDYEKVRDEYWYTIHGYVVGVPCGTNIHRYIMGAQQGFVVDHINGDKLDNRKSNLRICTQAENNRNRKPTENSAGIYKGVTLNASGAIVARITCNGRLYYLGKFETAEEAAHAYDKKAIELHGDFAKLNFPREYYEEKKEV